MDASTEAGSARTRKPRGQGSSRRGEILDAAKHLFLNEGFEHATMRRIAAEVGVSPTAIYLHFADKEAILDAIAEDFFSELLLEIQATQATDDPPMARYRAGIRAYVEFGLERPDEYRLTFQRRTLARTPCREIAVADRSFAILQSAVNDLVANGYFRPIDPNLGAEAIWCALHGLTCALIDMPEQISVPRDALIETVLDMMQLGLAAPAKI